MKAKSKKPYDDTVCGDPGLWAMGTGPARGSTWRIIVTPQGIAAVWHSADGHTEATFVYRGLLYTRTWRKAKPRTLGSLTRMGSDFVRFVVRYHRPPATEQARRSAAAKAVATLLNNPADATSFEEWIEEENRRVLGGIPRES